MKKIVVLTGVTAAGKKSLLRMFEQNGFCCISGVNCKSEKEMQNVLSLISASQSSFAVALCNNKDTTAVEHFVALIKSSFENAKAVFLECDAKKAAQRLKSLRLSHPLADIVGGDFVEASIVESKACAPIRELCDIDIDTTHLTTYELFAFLRDAICNETTGVVIKSFGHKYGMVLDADFVIDVRCLPNPFWVEELKEKSGLDKAVSDFVFANEDASSLYDSLFAMVKQLYALYIKEGRHQFTVAVGCTGGRHRSVAFAQRLYDSLKNDIKNIRIIHRDIDK